MTINTLSILSKLSETFLNKIEAEKKRPSLRSLTKLADAFDMNMIIVYSPGEKIVKVKFVMRDTVRTKSFEDRITELEPRLMTDCLKLCRYDSDKAKDLKQETIFQALIYHYRFNEKSQLYTWLYGIAKKLNMANRRSDKNLSFVDDFFETGEIDIEVKQYPRLAQYLNRLSPKAREVYKMRLNGIPYSDIANQLHITAAGAKSWFWTIKGSVKQMIEKEMPCN